MEDPRFPHMQRSQTAVRGCLKITVNSDMKSHEKCFEAAADKRGLLPSAMACRRVSRP